MRILFVSLVAVLSLLVFSSTALAGPKKDAGDQALTYFGHQKANQWNKACRMLSSRALSQWGGGSISGCVDNFATNGFVADHATVKRVVIWKRGARAYVILRVDDDHNWRLNFVKQNGIFRLDSDRS